MSPVPPMSNMARGTGRSGDHSEQVHMDMQNTPPSSRDLIAPLVVPSRILAWTRLRT